MKHEFALSAKLAAMDVGHVLYVPDSTDDVDRQIYVVVGRHKSLVGRKFTTGRADVITASRDHERVVRIERTA